MRAISKDYMSLCSPQIQVGRKADLAPRPKKMIKPNQSLEPTTTAVTSRACARLAPAAVVAHLKRSAKGMLATIKANAARLTELQNEVNRTVELRSHSPEGLSAWKQACDRFHQEYDSLAFPGGYARGLKQIAAGDLATISVAIEY